MKPTHWLAAATVLFASLPLMARQVGGSQSPAHDVSLAAEYLRPVTAELEGKLDAKIAKAGDRVVVKTTRDTILADGTEIPKGSRLVGQITQVVAHSRDRAESQLSLVLDRAELKDGISVPIHAMIQAVAPPPAAMTVESTGAGESFGGAGATAAGDAPVTGAGQAGGGMVGGGMVDGAVRGVAANDAGRAGSSLGSPAGGALNATDLDATDPVAGNPAGPVDRVLAGSEEGAVSTANRATAIPGVMLRGYIVGSTSGTLSAAGKNVHLDSGTQMLLGVAAK